MQAVQNLGMALVTVMVLQTACWFLLARSKVVHQHSAPLAHHDVDRRVSLIIGTNSHYCLLIWFGSLRTFQSFRNLVGLRMILSLLIHDGSIKSCTSTFCTFGSSWCGSLSKCDQDANLFLVPPPGLVKKKSRNDPDFRFFSKIPEIDGQNPYF